MRSDIQSAFRWLLQTVNSRYPVSASQETGGVASASGGAGVSPAVAGASRSRAPAEPVPSGAKECPRPSGRDAGATRPSRNDPAGDRSATMQVPRRSSRLPMMAPAPLADPAPRFVFAKCAVFCSFQAQNGANLRAKHAKFAAFKTVTSFVFKYFFASFPLFFIFCSSLHSPIDGTLPFSLAPRRAPAAPTTMCPQNNHHCRLS